MVVKLFLVKKAVYTISYFKISLNIKKIEIEKNGFFHIDQLLSNR